MSEMEHSAESDALPPLDEWLTEWAVEVTWRDWKAAGAKGPTSQYGPFEHPFQRDQFIAMQRKDRDVAATRVLTRRAVYTPWVGPDAPSPTSEEEREALLTEFYEQMTGTSATPPAVPADNPARAGLRGERGMG